jgi:hypothetical protein
LYRVKDTDLVSDFCMQISTFVEEAVFYPL